jgi:uncharacterized protein (DUF3820 family)
VADLTKIDLNAPTPNVVPFGKYKGRSIIELQETDPDYLQWLVAQDWFREKFITLHQTIINRGGEPSETPEHNYYQTLFLDEKFASAVFDAVHPGKREENFVKGVEWRFRDKHESLEKEAENLRWNFEWNLKHSKDTSRLDEYRNKIIIALGNIDVLKTQHAMQTMRPINPTRLDTIVVEFEVKGADIQMMLGDDHRCYHYHQNAVRVEIKPAIGDDYPAVLRQMKGSESNVLYLASYTGQGATLDQVRKIFKASGITILMHADFARYVEQ